MSTRRFQPRLKAVRRRAQRRMRRGLRRFAARFRLGGFPSFATRSADARATPASPVLEPPSFA